jgi:hypothetical protein
MDHKKCPIDHNTPPNQSGPNAETHIVEIAGSTFYAFRIHNKQSSQDPIIKIGEELYCPIGSIQHIVGANRPKAWLKPREGLVNGLIEAYTQLLESFDSLNLKDAKDMQGLLLTVQRHAMTIFGKDDLFIEKLHKLFIIEHTIGSHHIKYSPLFSGLTLDGFKNMIYHENSSVLSIAYRVYTNFSTVWNKTKTNKIPNFENLDVNQIHIFLNTLRLAPNGFMAAFDEKIHLDNLAEVIRNTKTEDPMDFFYEYVTGARKQYNNSIQEFLNNLEYQNYYIKDTVHLWFLGYSSGCPIGNSDDVWRLIAEVTHKAIQEWKKAKANSIGE